MGVGSDLEKVGVLASVAEDNVLGFLFVKKFAL